MKQLPDRLRSLIGSFPCSHQPRGTEVSQNPVFKELQQRYPVLGADYLWLADKPDGTRFGKVATTRQGP